MKDVNRVVLCGRLTRDPELRTAGSQSVCGLRLAVNGSRKNPSTDQWEDVPNYFDVSVWGTQGENCNRYLSKGRGCVVDGRLQWREWTDTNGNKRQSVDIVAENVQFIGGRDDGGNGGGRSQAVDSDAPIDTSDFEAAPVGGGVPASDEEIPF